MGLIHKHGQVLLIDSGNGSVLDAAKKRGITSVEWVLFTHYHRDQCSGAPLLKNAGVKIAVPASSYSRVVPVLEPLIVIG